MTLYVGAPGPIDRRPCGTTQIDKPQLPSFDPSPLTYLIDCHVAVLGDTLGIFQVTLCKIHILYSRLGRFLAFVFG